MQTILYACVSTLEQTLAHQRTQAEVARYVIDDVVADEEAAGVAFISTTAVASA